MGWQALGFSLQGWLKKLVEVVPFFFPFLPPLHSKWGDGGAL